MTQSATFGAVPTGLGSQVRQDFNLADQAAATEHEGAFAPSVIYPFMRWRNDAGKLLRRRNAGNTAWEIIENYGAVTDPTVNDDAADGYIRAAIWINVAAGRLFFCTDATIGAAVWVQAGGGGGGVASVFGRTGAVGAQAGDYTADQIGDGGGKVVMTAAERSTLTAISFPAKVIPLVGTGSSADNANIRAAIAAIKASGQPGELLMSGDFMIGHEGDLSGIDPDSCPDLRLTGRGYCRWYKGVAATTTGLTGGEDPADGSAYRLLARDIDDGPGKTLVIRNILFEGDLETTMKQLGDGSRLIALDHYDRVELIDVEGRWASQMAFTFGYCNQVRASRIHLNRIARDGLNASNCADVAVTDSDFEWIIDDCCAANLSAVVADDPGQQRAFRFVGNRVYNAQGVKVLGGKHIAILGNSFRAPLNYAVFLGSDASYGEGARPIEDVLVYANTVTDLVTADQYGNDNVVDTAIIASQFGATPHNIVIRGNILAQRTTTSGLTWSQLKLRGIEGENRQWRQDGPTGSMLWYDPVLSEEIFVGQGKAVRVEAPNGLDRLTYDIDDNRTEGFSDDAFLRSQPAWAGDQLWAVPVSAGEYPAGATARLTGLDLRGYQDMRLVVRVGSPGGPAGAQLLWSFSLDGGGTWTPTLATVTLDEANQTMWGPWQPIPPTLRQTIDAQLALFGERGDGATQVRLLEVSLDIRGVDQTSAARLLPSKITPAEITDPVETELRSFSPADVAAIAGVGPGGSAPAFGRIAVDGQADVVADGAADTLTLAGANGIAVTTDPAANTVTIAPTYGSGTDTVCQGDDARLADARTPTAHTHGAADLTDKGDFYARTRGTGLSDTGGSIAVAYGATATTACAGNDARLSDARAPTSHASSHKSGGGDAISVTEFGGFATGKLAGRTSAGSGALETITPSANLSLTAGTLDVVGPVASALGLTGAVSVDSLAEDTAPDKAADFLCTYDASASAHRKVRPQNLVPYDILCGIVGKPSNAEVVLLFVASRPFRIPANAAASRLKAGTAAAGTAVFSMQKNGTQFLTATVGASATTATFACSQTDFAAGDVLRIVAPATADASLADIAITLAATLL